MRHPQLTAELATLERELQALLGHRIDGISEHQLLRELRDAGHPGFPRGLFMDSLQLFRAHFRLFHVLYRLQGRLSQERSGTLEISPLLIRLSPFREGGGSAVAGWDGLRDYYLDLDRLHGTSAEQVEQMLGAFWRRFCATQQRAEALECLGLQDPVGEEEIRLQYRRLAMRHHPDRGGDRGEFQRIRQAMEMLRGR